MHGFIKLKISTKESTGSCSISMAWILITSTKESTKKKKVKEKLASEGEDEAEKKSKMLGLVIRKLVTCLGSHDEGCLLRGLISSFLLFSFFFVVFFFHCFFFFFSIFLFLFFIFLRFIWFQIWKNPKYCWSMGRNFAEKREPSEPQKPITVLRTVQSDHGSHGSLLFSHRTVLEAKKTKTGFKTLVRCSKKMKMCWHWLKWEFAHKQKKMGWNFNLKLLFPFSKSASEHQIYPNALET